jgi:hypothetical protein
MKIIYHAGGLIERDALVARLKAEGIEPYIPPESDITSRRVTPSVVDLSLGEASPFQFKGFAVYVNEPDFAQAQSVLKEWQQEHKTPHLREFNEHNEPSELNEHNHAEQNEADSTLTNHWKSFYFYAFATLVLPGPTHFLALWELLKNIRHLSQVRPVYFVFANILLLITGVLWGAVLYNYLSR